MVLGQAAQAADRPLEAGSAQWERQASEWAVRAYRAALDRLPEEWAAAVRALRPPPASPLPEELRQAADKTGLVLFERPFYRPIDKWLPPASAEARGARFEMAAARGEWESLQIGIWAARPLSGLSFAVTDLVREGGRGRIVAARHVKALYGMNLLFRMARKAEALDGDIAPGAQKAAWSYAERPAVLLDLPSIYVPQGEARSLWLDVFIPQDAVAGTYRGRIAFRLAGREVARVPLAVTVYPFVLDDAPQWARGPFTPKYLDRPQLIQLREHGINTMSWWTADGTTIERKDGQVVADFKAYSEYLKQMDSLGYVGPHVVFLGGSDPKIENRIMKFLGRPTVEDARNRASATAFEKSDLSEPFGRYLCDVLRQFHGQMKAAGHPDMLACLMDEPDHEPRPTRRDYYNRVFALVEKGAPEVPLYGTFYHDGDEDRLSHHHKVWCSNCPSPAKANACRKAGQSLFTYGGGYGYAGENETQRFRMGILPWVYGARGTYFWAMYWHNGDPFDPFVDNKNFDTACLPTPEGPLATPVIKTIREAIDDRRYLVTLEKRIERALQSKDQAVREQAQADIAWLDSFRQPLFETLEVRGGRPIGTIGPVTAAGRDGRKATIGPDESGSWAFSEFVRREVARRIVSLQSRLGPEP